MELENKTYKTTMSSDIISLKNVLMYMPTMYLHSVYSVDQHKINGNHRSYYQSLVLDDDLLCSCGFEKDSFGLYYNEMISMHHLKKVSTTYQLCQDAGLPIMGIFTFNKLQNAFKMISGFDLKIKQD